MPNLAWVDLETTGLNPTTDEILKIGIIVTDYELTELGSAHWLLNPWGNQLEQAIQTLDPFIIDMHNKSGLFNDLRDDHFHKFNTFEGHLIKEISRVLQDYDAVNVPMCGSTINFDRGFLTAHLPQAVKLFHYRNIDVSTVKELYKIQAITWKTNYPYLVDLKDALGHTDEFPEWEGSDPKPHRALPDIRESIAELKFYREHLFR